MTELYAENMQSFNNGIRSEFKRRGMSDVSINQFTKDEAITNAEDRRKLREYVAVVTGWIEDPNPPPVDPRKRINPRTGRPHR